MITFEIMYSQAFTPRELYLCATQSERRNFPGGKEDMLSMIEKTIGDSIVEGTYRLKLVGHEGLFLNNQDKGPDVHLCQNLVLRKLYHNIRRIYKVSQANRNSIVKQILTLLKEDVPLWIIRLDIHHFYESIDRKLLFNRIIDKGRLNFQSTRLLQLIDSYLVSCNASGLPRGLAISSALSEEYMRYFDLDIKRMDGVYYYARFVDDIIIFCSSEKAQQDVYKALSPLLSELKLALNLEKSYCWSDIAQDQTLTYLGYTFRKKEITECVKGKNIKSQVVEVTIAEKKIKMIKSRITLAFVRYSKDHDFEMLCNRVKFLTGNFTIYSKTTLAPIKVGVHFNYKEITKTTQLLELDRYFQRILHNKRGKLGSMFSFTATQIACLSKYSFLFGFKHHVNHYFSTAMLTKIKECWL